MLCCQMMAHLEDGGSLQHLGHECRHTTQLAVACTHPGKDGVPVHQAMVRTVLQRWRLCMTGYVQDSAAKMAYLSIRLWSAQYCKNGISARQALVRTVLRRWRLCTKGYGQESAAKMTSLYDRLWSGQCLCRWRLCTKGYGQESAAKMTSLYDRLWSGQCLCGWRPCATCYGAAPQAARDSVLSLSARQLPRLSAQLL